jgi:hypothetical protein
MIRAPGTCLGNLEFVDQIEVAIAQKASGSGSLLVSLPPGSLKALGLMFAAQPGGEFGYANQISNVLTPLGVTMDTTAAPSAQSPSETEQPQQPSAEQIQAGQVVDAFGPYLMKIPGVWGISPGGGPDGISQ